MTKILLDTDIGTDVDDAVALAYLLAQPECELLGITTVTGQAVERAKLCSVLCHAAGRPDIPIYPGRKCRWRASSASWWRSRRGCCRAGLTRQSFRRGRRWTSYATRSVRTRAR